MFLKNVWWPLFGNFEDLHPEYEVPDWRGRPYFGDFAYLPGNLKFMIEIKGFGPHVQDMDRKNMQTSSTEIFFCRHLVFAWSH